MPGVYSKPVIEDRRVVLERRVRSELEVLVNNWDGDRDEEEEGGGGRGGGGGGRYVLMFEPMEKQMRFVIHEVVENDYSNRLVSISTGDDEERHVEVYIKGYEPVSEENGVEVGEGLQVTAMKRSRGKHAPTHLSSSPSPSLSLSSSTGEQLVRVGLVKRDRRTIEEIQQNMQKRPKGDH
mmetsp:Transcript_37924/g.38609  ORF Transcript_37924/g.38609 Transcript_37924/m.38609 type:complete len:180 (-) Transcript_37924:25-564(-)